MALAQQTGQRDAVDGPADRLSEVPRGPSASTAAVPATMMKKSLPRNPSRTIRRPLGKRTSSN
ncbi:MAG: hypothetical protein ACRENL_03645 [Candidatus Dormibacteria bacterium]